MSNFRLDLFFIVCIIANRCFGLVNIKVDKPNSNLPFTIDGGLFFGYSPFKEHLYAIQRNPGRNQYQLDIFKRENSSGTWTQSDYSIPCPN